MKKTFKDLVMESSDDVITSIEEILTDMSDDEIDAVGSMIIDTYFDTGEDVEDDESDDLEDEEFEPLTLDDVMGYIEMLDDESLEEIYDAISGEMREAAKLKKTSKSALKLASKYRKSPEGKKAAKLQKIKMAKLEKKYAKQISKCKDKGKVFSFKTLECEKAKKRR